jgi:hypothetical protein
VDGFDVSIVNLVRVAAGFGGAAQALWRGNCTSAVRSALPDRVFACTLPARTMF